MALIPPIAPTLCKYSNLSPQSPAIAVVVDYEDRKEGWRVVAAGSALVYPYNIVQLHFAKARLASVSTLAFMGSVAAPLVSSWRHARRAYHQADWSQKGFFYGSFYLTFFGELTAGWWTKSVTQRALYGLGAALL